MLRSLAVLAIFVPGLVFALFDRYIALLLYLWFALFRPQEWIWIDVTSLRLSLVVGIVLVVPALASGVLPTVRHPLALGMVLFLGVCLLAQLHAVAPGIGWLWIDYMARLVIVCLLAVTLLNTRARCAVALAVIAGSFCFHPAKAGLASIIGGGVQFYDGLAGAFIDNNGYALGTVMAMFLLIPAAQNLEHRWVRRGLFLAVPMSAFTVISLFSRGGFLALGAATVVFLILQRRGRLLGMLCVTAAVPVMLSIVPLPEGWLGRMQTISSYDEVEDTSALSRLHFWDVAIAMAVDQPFGVGLRQYEAAYNKYDFSHGQFGENRAAHSSHFQILAETGFAGAAIYLAVFVCAFLTAFRIRARSKHAHIAPPMQRLLFTTANGIIASMTGYLVGGAFVAAALNDLTWLTFALLAALDRLPPDGGEAQEEAQPAQTMGWDAGMGQPVLVPERGPL